MNPLQRDLYLRYHDILLNDNTAQTNRFNMPLNISVMIDTNGRSRIVACALVSGETTDDYEWILQQLLDATDGIALRVIVIDKDPAMEAACINQIPDTSIIYCIWH